MKNPLVAGCATDMLFLNLADMQLIVSALLVLISSYMVVSGPMRSNLHDRRLYNRTSARLTTDFDQDEGLFGTFDATQGLSLESVLKNGSCYDGDYRYSIGETFKLHYDPCRQCVCTKRGVQCSVILCPLIPDSCIAVERSPHQCCVRCVKEGCNFDNETFHVGEIIRVSPCQSCKCETDGRADCSVADCQPPRCVDYVYRPGECCPTCPRGANCFAMGTVIPASHTAVIPRKCVRCTCPLGDLGERYWLGSHQARCHVIESCRTDVTTRTRLRRSSKRYFNEYIKLEGRDRNP